MNEMKISQRSPEPFLFETENKEFGILLVHGFTGTTAELRPLGTYLHKEGFTVHAPLLKGHGVTPEEMNCTTWVDWYSSAEEGYHRLKEIGCRKIIVIGLSMGGLLTLKLAQHHDVFAMVTLCAAIEVKDKRMGLVRYVQYFKQYLKRRGHKADHIEKELFIYDKTPLACVASLDNLIKNVRLVLPHLTQPILIVQAEQDETVDPCSGQLLYDLIGSKEKELKMFAESSHIITLDKEREALFLTITHFIRKMENNNLYTTLK